MIVMTTKFVPSHCCVVETYDEYYTHFINVFYFEIYTSVKI